MIALPHIVFDRQEDIRRIADRWGAERIRLIGSVARGDFRSDSDVDFLVRLAPGRTLFDLGGLQSDLQDLLGLPVDVATESGLKGTHRDSVMNEAITL